MVTFVDQVTLHLKAGNGGDGVRVAREDGDGPSLEEGERTSQERGIVMDTLKEYTIDVLILLIGLVIVTAEGITERGLS